MASQFPAFTQHTAEYQVAMPSAARALIVDLEHTDCTPACDRDLRIALRYRERSVLRSVLDVGNNSSGSFKIGLTLGGVH